MHDQARTVRGTVEVIWHARDGEQHLLFSIDPETVGAPHTFEIEGQLSTELAHLNEGDTVEVTYRAEEHEVIDPDSGPTESYRARVIAVDVVEG